MNKLDDIETDSYLEKVKNILDDSYMDTNAMEFHNISIMSSINKLMLNYDFLHKSIKQEIQICKLNLDQTFKRCIEIYGKTDCHKKNNVSFGPTCPKDYVLYNDYVCYKKCNENYEEHYNKCKKP